MSSLIGRTIGPYLILGIIGQGGMGAVYRASHRREGYHVALKVLTYLAAADAAIVQRFEDEARAILGLRHPHIIRLYDAGRSGGLPYLAMELIQGGSLAERLRSGRPIDVREAARWVSEIASALDYAHDRQVIHRDIKPGNVLLAPDSGRPGEERAVLTDFGIARGADSRRTVAGQVLGTPSYMSPEQAQGRPVDCRSDVYSLGILAYEMLGGRLPFAGETLAVLRAQVYDPPPPIRRLNRRLSRGAEQVLERALAKRPEDRYPTAGAFALALDSSLGARSAVRRRTGAAPSGSRRWLGFGALGLVVILAALVIWKVSGEDETAEVRSRPAPPTAVAATDTLAFVRASDSNNDGTIDEHDRADVCILDLATGQWRFLTRGPAYSGAPDWSPDGSRLVFASNRDGNMEIYVMGADGTGIVRLTENYWWDSGPAWSPASAVPLIAFDGEPNNSDSEILLLNTWGGPPRSLTSDAALDGDPAWSPDGRSIAFSSGRDGNMAIYVMAASGNDLRRVTQAPADDLAPAWSPDGGSLVFARGLAGLGFDLYRVSLDSLEETRLTHHEGTDRWPTWSPDGQWIAFARQSSGTRAWDLMLVSSDGQEERAVLSDGTANTHPAWKP